jgi:hypothetical protein
MTEESALNGFAMFCELASDRQLFGILEKERAAGRKPEIRIVKAEIRRRGLTP